MASARGLFADGFGEGQYRFEKEAISHRIHGAAIYGNMDPINIPPLC